MVFRNDLVPEVRTNKNGVPVKKWVKPPSSGVIASIPLSSPGSSEVQAMKNRIHDLLWTVGTLDIAREEVRWSVSRFIQHLPDDQIRDCMTILEVATHERDILLSVIKCSGAVLGNVNTKDRRDRLKVVPYAIEVLDLLPRMFTENDLVRLGNLNSHMGKAVLHCVRETGVRKTDAPQVQRAMARAEVMLYGLTFIQGGARQHSPLKQDVKFLMDNADTVEKHFDLLIHRAGDPRPDRELIESLKIISTPLNDGVL